MSVALEQHRIRCFELTDELIAHQRLTKELKKNLCTAHAERKTLLFFFENNNFFKFKFKINSRKPVIGRKIRFDFK